MKKPRVLIISFATFFPAVSGGRIVNYNNARLLSRHFDLEIVFPTPIEEQDKEGLKQLSHIAKIHTIDIDEASSRRRVLSTGLRTLVSRYPIIDLSRFYAHPQVKKLIREDFLFIQLTTSWWYHPELKHRQGGLVLLQHNWEYEYWRQMATALFALHQYCRSLYYRLISGKVRRQEAEVMNNAQAVIALSEREREIFRRVYHRENDCYTVAQGIDIKLYEPWGQPGAAHTSRETLSLVYAGSLNMPQHAAGVLEFVREIYPRLKAASRVQYHLYLIGTQPPLQLQRLAERDSSITLTHGVDDVKPWISRADIYIVPMLHGSGIRLKIMEAMAMGKPVVSTYKGAEGLKLDTAGIILTQTLEAFIPAIERLASQPEQREQMGRANRAYAIDHFDCERIFYQQMLPVYQKFLTHSL